VLNDVAAAAVDGGGGGGGVAAAAALVGRAGALIPSAPGDAGWPSAGRAVGDASWWARRATGTPRAGGSARRGAGCRRRCARRVARGAEASSGKGAAGRWQRQPPPPEQQ